MGTEDFLDVDTPIPGQNYACVSFISRGEDIEKEFSEENKNVTSVRGIKVRGVYDTLREAEVRSKVLQRKDPNFNIYVAQVGYWVPWDPSYDETQVIEKQEHMNEQLNELMKKHKENTEMRNV